MRTATCELAFRLWINHWMWWDDFNIEETSEVLYSEFKEYKHSYDECNVQIIQQNKKKTSWEKHFLTEEF